MQGPSRNLHERPDLSDTGRTAEVVTDNHLVGSMAAAARQSLFTPGSARLRIPIAHAGVRWGHVGAVHGMVGVRGGGPSDSGPLLPNSDKVARHRTGT